MQVIVVGQADTQLDALLRQAGLTVVWLNEPAAATTKGSTAEAIVVDARGREHLPSFIAPLMRDSPESGFILLCSRLDPTLMLEAMHAGIRECLAEPIDAAELDAALTRVAAKRRVDGLVFAFIGAKGGVGTTTTAVNVALELSRVAPKQTLLIDLHLSDGDAGVFLGENPRFSVADALENAQRLDEAFFGSLVVRSKGRLDLLASPETAIGGPADPVRLRALIEYASGRYRYTVLDVPRSDASVLEALDRASRIVIIANQEVPGVRTASRMAARLRQRYGKERLSVVLSRYDPIAEVGQDDIEKTVGSRVRHVVPSNYRRAVDALNDGKPLSLDNHNNLAGAYRAIARELAGLPLADDTDRSSGRLFGFRAGRHN